MIDAPNHHLKRLQDVGRGADHLLMPPLARLRLRQLAAVTLVGTVMGAAAIFGFMASQETPPPGTTRPFASIYHDPLSPLDVVLTGGDGHAFTVIAEDPTLSRPQVLREPAEFAYRAQRPVWGYLDWIGSLGQARFTGWVLVILTLLSCSAACAVAGLLLLDREVSPWWALVVPVAGFETLSELTPELFSLALVGIGVRLWQRDRRGYSVAILSVAVLTRETMLIAVGALALFALWHEAGALGGRTRAVAPLTIPLATYVAWIAFLRVRLGDWPFHRSGDRLGLPGRGLVTALHATESGSAILFWVVVGIALCVAVVVFARHDVLAWVTVAFAAFATLLGPDVWVTNMGFERALLPLYVFGPIAAVAGFRARSWRRSAGDGQARPRIGARYRPV